MCVLKQYAKAISNRLARGCAKKVEKSLGEEKKVLSLMGWGCARFAALFRAVDSGGVKAPI